MGPHYLPLNSTAYQNSVNQVTNNIFIGKFELIYFLLSSLVQNPTQLLTIHVSRMTIKMLIQLKNGPIHLKSPTTLILLSVSFPYIFFICKNYLISISFSFFLNPAAQERCVIGYAMKKYHENTCIRFVPRNDESDFIQIKKLNTPEYVYLLQIDFSMLFSSSSLINVIITLFFIRTQFRV